MSAFGFRARLHEHWRSSWHVHSLSSFGRTATNAHQVTSYLQQGLVGSHSLLGPIYSCVGVKRHTVHAVCAEFVAPRRSRGSYSKKKARNLPVKKRIGDSSISGEHCWKGNFVGGATLSHSPLAWKVASAYMDHVKGVHNTPWRQTAAGTFHSANPPAKPRSRLSKRLKVIERASTRMKALTDHVGAVSGTHLKVVPVQATHVCQSASLVASLVAHAVRKKQPPQKVWKKLVKSVPWWVKGIRLVVSGRIRGAEIARKMSYKWGVSPLHTLDMLIDTSQTRLLTVSGCIGVKVWICYERPEDLTPIGKKLK